jgi:oxygen-independent coproporphyrinogen-3 oxidase
LNPVPHVYAHFPFCVQKCPYCDFNSHAGRENEVDLYVEALLEETRNRARGLEPATLFVGGGTPTHAEPRALARYLAGLRDLLGDRNLREFTVEANPGSVTAEKARVLADAGVTRVSMGAQSFDARHLKTLGRVHGPDDARRSVDLLRAAGIAHLSVDIILAIPGQTLAEQEADAEAAVLLGTEHLSAYVLTYEEGTPFTRWMRAGRLPPPDDERELEHQGRVAERFEAAGLRRYEISNFARPGAECRHNLGYWLSRDWWALGAGAHGHVAGRRWKNLSDPAAYARAVRETGSAEEWSETGDLRTRLFDALMMGLRLVDGVDLDVLLAETGLDARVEHAAALERHVENGLLTLAGNRLAPTARGLDLASYIARSFLPEEHAVGSAATT